MIANDPKMAPGMDLRDSHDVPKNGSRDAPKMHPNSPRHPSNPSNPKTNMADTMVGSMPNSQINGCKIASANVVPDSYAFTCFNIHDF